MGAWCLDMLSGGDHEDDLYETLDPFAGVVLAVIPALGGFRAAHGLTVIG